jgi:predicted alpha/beta superfamily hydrolase
VKRSFLFFTVLLLFSSLFFAQETPLKITTAATNVSIIQKEFVIPNLNAISHKIWVYLPPNYEKTSKKYPVIYMHDAQNLFDNATSFAGEWEVDETLNKLFDKTGEGFIVVGIENGGAERINEYTPWKNEKYGGGKGAIYIDSNYRTKKQQKHTGLVGSSLGGLISYYGGLKYPGTFGKIGALSASFWFSKKVEEFTKENGDTKKVKMHLLVGGKEGYDMSIGTEKMEKLLLETGFKSKNLKININPDGNHNEAFWKSEFLAIVKWLYNIN